MNQHHLPGVEDSGESRSPMLIKLKKITTVLVSVTISAMIAITVCDVTGRYVFNSPIPGATELTEVLMALLIFVSLPLVTLKNDHIVVDIIDNWLSKSMTGLLQCIGDLLGMVIFAIISWRLWILAGRAASYGDQTPLLEIPMYPVVYGMAIMSGLTCALFGYKAGQFFTRRLQRGPAATQARSHRS
ncbi:TRAP transporter small permease [Vibrio sp.]|uniref:TRAP transporter small permease n=1 Tax=Vibrio sp. TaxID=678 RepID=UPI003D0B93AE